MSFPRFTCIQCTRRLSRLAQSSKTSSHPLLRQIAPRFSHEYTPSLATHYLYSTGSGRRKVRAVMTPNTFARVRFTRADVPPRGFWDAQVRATLVTDLSAEECFQAARAYVDAAVRDSSEWRERLITTADQSPDSQGKILSAYTLHYVAVVIAINGLGQASHIATHILHTLTGLDYVPSILTLVRVGLLRKVLDQPQFEPAVQGLERTLRRIDSNKNPTGKGGSFDFAADAYTLRALIYAAEDTREGDNDALRWFRRAYEISGTISSTAGQKDEVGASDNIEGVKFDPRWQLKPSFALGVAAIRMKRGELEKAKAMYAMASSELDTATGYLGMANLLEKMGNTDTDEYVEALEKAAVSGNLEAARKLGTRERSRAAEGGLSKWEKRKRQVFAEEWMAIASAAVPAEA